MVLCPSEMKVEICLPGYRFTNMVNFNPSMDK